MATNATTEISTHEKFNAADADVIIQSSDGVQFHLHRKYLEVNTGAFPGDESAALIRSDGQGDVVHLTEPAEILEILFEFVYPRRHPSLEEIGFETLAPLAEAVEKYEVFAAMTTCEVRLKRFIPTDSLDILAHGIKHDYPRLVNEAALQLCRSRMPLDDIIEKLPDKAQMPWLRYHEAWRAIFVLAQNREIIDHYLCNKCQGIMMLWFTQLEQTGSLADLQTKLVEDLPKDYRKATIHCTCHSRYKSGVLPLFLSRNIIKVLEIGIESMQPFTDYVNDSRAAKHAVEVAIKIAYDLERVVLPDADSDSD